MARDHVAERDGGVVTAAAVNWQWVPDFARPMIESGGGVMPTETDRDEVMSRCHVYAEWVQHLEMGLHRVRDMMLAGDESVPPVTAADVGVIALIADDLESNILHLQKAVREIRDFATEMYTLSQDPEAVA